jgi:probable rRNA maturation factor
MAIEIIDRQKRIRIDRRSTRRLVERALLDHARGGADVSIVFADDEFVRALNASYRGKDRPTDVLAFPMPGGGAAGRAPEVDGPEPMLGDVVISTDRAAAQARRFRRTEGREILKLVSHGVLHLLGHDHEKTADRAAMRKLENRYVREAAAGSPTVPTIGSRSHGRGPRPARRGRS